MVKLKTKSIKRKFGGRVYTNVASKSTKKEAVIRANAWRKLGYSVRIVKLKRGYDIYIRD